LIPFLEEVSRGFRDEALVHVFLYNVHMGYECYLDESINDFDSHSLENGIIDKYYVIGKRLWSYHNRPISISIQDFGISIIMYWFAYYYSRNRYTIFVLTFQSVNELELLETFLVNYRATSLKLPSNLATDERYGIAANINNFINSEAMTVTDFNTITAIMRINYITPENFISVVERYPLRIISSIYMFTSITKDLKLIKECRELSNHKYNYRVQVVKTPNYNGDYWFYVPPKSVWFAYMSYGTASWTYQSYVSRDVDCSMYRFRNLKNSVLIGFVTNDIVVPIIIRSQELNNDWDNMIKYVFPVIGTSSVLYSTEPPTTVKNIHFIRNKDPTIYKLVRVKNKGDE